MCGADLILLFLNEPHSSVISADGGSKTKPLYRNGYLFIESNAQSQGGTLNTEFEKKKLTWAKARNKKRWSPFSLQGRLSDLKVNQTHLGGLLKCRFPGTNPRVSDSAD